MGRKIISNFMLNIRRIELLEREKSIREQKLLNISYKENIQMEINKLNTKIKECESDLKGIFKDNDNIKNKKRVLQEQRNNLVNILNKNDTNK